MGNSRTFDGKDSPNTTRRLTLQSASTLVIMSVCTGGVAFAQCAPQAGNAKLIDCTGNDPNGYADASDDLTVSVAPTAIVVGPISVDDRNAINNAGRIADIVVDDFNTVINNGTVSKLIFIGNNNTITNNGLITVSGSEAIFSSEQNNTINNTGTISAAGNSREAVQITGVNARVTGSGTISTTGNTSEAIELGTGATVTYSGTVQTTGTTSHGISVGSGSTVTLRSGAIVMTSGAGAVGINNLDDGVSISIVEAGASILTTGDGASGIVDADDPNITLNGRIQTSGANAYAVDADDDSIVTIASTGSVITSGSGSRGLVVGRRSVVSNAGSVSASGVSGDGILFDEGQAVLTNSGSITSAQAYGVLLDDDEPGTSSSITNLAGGTISGAAGSIATAGLTDAEGTEESIFNYGSLIGSVTLGAGSDLFALYNDGSVSGAVELGLGNDQFFFQNADLSGITGVIDAGDGFDRADGRYSADGVVNFSGAINFEFYTVEAIGAETDVTIAASPLSAPLALYGDGAFTNNADVTAINDTALSLVDSGGRLVNRGILSTTGDGSEALTAGDAATLVHEGSITTAGSDSEGIQASNGASITVSSTGRVSTVGSGSEGVQAGDNSSIVVAGSITTSGANSEGIQLNINGDVRMLEGSLIMTSGEGAEGIEMDSGSAARIAGQIETQGAFSAALRTRGPANVTVDASGALRANADDTVAVRLQSGGILANAGNIVSTGAGNAAALFLDAGAETLNNSGTIRSENDVAIFIADGVRSTTTIINAAAGVISGARGSIVTAGAANSTAETIINAGSLVGDVALAGGDDRFVLQSGGRFTGDIIDMGDGDDTFSVSGGSLDAIGGTIFGGRGNDSFLYDSGDANLAASDVFGFERLEQRAGRLTTTDDVTFDQILISGGTFVLSAGDRILPNDFNNPSARTNVAIGPGGELTGSGEVVGSVISDGLIRIARGASLQISGNLALNGGSLIDLDLTDDNVPGIRISGLTTLNGGAIRLNGAVVEDRVITLIQSDGGVSDVFGLNLVFSNNVPFTEVSDLIIGATSVTVRVDQKLLDPSLGAPASRAGKYVLGQLQGADADLLGAFSRISDGVTDANLESVLLGLSPEIYASAPLATSIEESRTLINQLSDALLQEAEGARVWAAVLGTRSDYKVAGAQQDFDLSSVRTVAGADIGIFGQLRLGGLLGFGETQANFETASNTFDARHFSVGGYGAYDIGDFIVNGAVTYATSSVEVKRSLANGAVADKVAAEFEIKTLGLHTGALWTAPVEGWDINADTAFDWLVIERDAFTETGSSPLALNVDGDKIDAPLASVGFSVAKPVDIHGMVISPRGSVRFVHNFSDAEHTARAGFIGGDGQTFFAGPAILPDDIVESSVGLSLSGHAWTVSGAIDYGAGEEQSTFGGRLKASYRF